MSDTKQHRDYCEWCGRLKYLMPDTGVCGACEEDEDFLNVQAHNARMDNRAGTKRENLKHEA